MLINFLAAVCYFHSRDNEEWADIPVWASLAATVTALLIAVAVLGEFVGSSSDHWIVYMGLGLAYILDTLIMGVYFLADGIVLLYNFCVKAVNHFFPGAI